MPTIEEVEVQLVAAMEAARAKGLKVRTGDWGVSVDYHAMPPVWSTEPTSDYRPTPGCLCPMGCLILGVAAGHGSEGMEDTAAELLGCTSKQVENFVVGFDSVEAAGVPFDEDEFYRLGQKLRGQVDPNPLVDE